MSKFDGPEGKQLTIRPKYENDILYAIMELENIINYPHTIDFNRARAIKAKNFLISASRALIKRIEKKIQGDSQ
jgi:hypothetical protein